MVTYEAEEHEQTNARLSFIAPQMQIMNERVLSASIYFPPATIRARISYQRRRYFSPRIHLDVQLKPRIDSTGQLSYQTGTLIKILLYYCLLKKSFFFISCCFIFVNLSGFDYGYFKIIRKYLQIQPHHTPHYMNN